MGLEEEAAEALRKEREESDQALMRARSVAQQSLPDAAEFARTMQKHQVATCDFSDETGGRVVARAGWIVSRFLGRSEPTYGHAGQLVEAGYPERVGLVVTTEGEGREYVIRDGERLLSSELAAVNRDDLVAIVKAVMAGKPYPVSDGLPAEGLLAHGPAFFSSGRARQLLLDAGVPTMDVHYVFLGFERKMFIERQVERVRPVGRGWLLGEYQWYYSGGDRGRSSRADAPTILLDMTTLAEHVAAEEVSGFRISSFIVPGRADARHGGYAIPYRGNGRFEGSWGLMAARVREMASVK